jgi:hypothetical protein
MIYWLIFDGGVGGDGFANMLEHANNIEPVDGILKWRHERTPSGKIRFWYPKWVNPTQWFRWHKPDFEYGIEELTTVFSSLLDTNANVVIPVHKCFYVESTRFKFQHVLKTENKKICLYSDNIPRLIDDFIDKQPPDEMTPELAEFHRNSTTKFSSRILHHAPWQEIKNITFIDIDRTWTDWEYLNNHLMHLGIDLPRERYEEYLDISERRPKTI